MRGTRYLKFLVAAMLAAAIVIGSVSEPVSASRFSDVSSDSPYYSAVEYAAAHGIACGIGDGKFGVDQGVMASQAVLMLCRAVAPDKVPAGNITYSEAYNICDDLDWFGESPILHETPLNRGQFYELAFAAFDVDVFSPSLYDSSLSSGTWESVVYAAKTFGFCGEHDTASDIVSRGEAVHAIVSLIQKEHKMPSPEILSKWKIDNPENQRIGPYLFELNRVPDSIRETFEKRGFTYSINKAALDEYNEEHGGYAFGLFNPAMSVKSIFVSTPSATVHEFGHFVDYCLDYPSEKLGSEMDAGRVFLPAYSETSVGEYYAEYFVYFLAHGNDKGCILTMKEHTPETYAHFAQLAAENWPINEVG